jgi:hypothetical protein
MTLNFEPVFPGWLVVCLVVAATCLFVLATVSSFRLGRELVR